MLNNQNVKFLFALGLAGSSVANLACAANSAATQKLISDQRSRQIARQVTDGIVSRVANDIEPNTPGTQKQKLPGASADGDSWMPDTLWSTFNWSAIGNDGSTTPFHTNIYQTTTGIDKKFGDFYAGVSVAYAGTTIDSGAFKPSPTTDTVGQGYNNFVGFTPYVAYVVNKNFFINALSGYNSISEHFLDTNTAASGAKSFVNTQSDADNYKFELDLNGLHTFNQWFFTGKAGARFAHTSTHKRQDTTPTTTVISDFNGDVMTYLSSVEGGYAFGNGFRTYTGILYEFAQASHAVGSSVFYYHAGFDYAVSNRFSLGVKAQTDLSNQQVDITTVGLNIRLLLD